MPDIINKTDAVVLLRFNSGLTRHLAPREVLRGIEHVEVKGNPRIRHLRERHVIALETDPQRRRGEERPVGSRDMSAADAVAHIRGTPLEELEGFLSPDENRATVRRAMEEKRQG